MSIRRRALLSVSDKTGIVELGRGLVERDWELLSTGGTARVLREEGELPVTEVARVTGHPEMMEGRVKTLHPAIHAGLLARRDRPDDVAALEREGYGPIDLVAVNLYPFRETVSGGGVDTVEAMEQVDIGGPTMIRAAAKNHRWVWVVVDPADYPGVLEALDREEGGERAGDGEGTGTRADAADPFRSHLAAKVFRHMAGYDEAVADFLEGEAETGTVPRRLVRHLERARVLRYGENPDQPAGFFVAEGAGRVGLAGLVQLHGKELSYNNLLDLDGALLSLAPFALSARPAVCIVKHTTPCGLAVGDALASAYERALATDPVSAFGSVIAVNRDVDGATAGRLSELFVECVAAPGFGSEALEILARKKSLRLLTFPDEGVPDGALPEGALEGLANLPDEVRPAARYLAAHGRRPDRWSLRSVYGGALLQQSAEPPFYGGRTPREWRVASSRQPDEREWDDLLFAWGAVFGVKSNAILLARDGATVGIGAGQMSRVDSSRIAVRKAGDAGLELQGSVLASDAFFPFRDGVDAAAEAGVRAIIQPGGSVRDDEVVAAADEHGMAMVFTGRRLFRH